MRKYKMANKIIDCVEWNPSKEKGLLLSVANEEFVFIISTLT